MICAPRQDPTPKTPEEPAPGERDRESDRMQNCKFTPPPPPPPPPPSIHTERGRAAPHIRAPSGVPSANGLVCAIQSSRSRILPRPTSPAERMTHVLSHDCPGFFRLPMLIQRGPPFRFWCWGLLLKLLPANCLLESTCLLLFNIHVLSSAGSWSAGWLRRARGRQCPARGAPTQTRSPAAAGGGCAAR